MTIKQLEVENESPQKLLHLGMWWSSRVGHRPGLQTGKTFSTWELLLPAPGLTMENVPFNSVELSTHPPCPAYTRWFLEHVRSSNVVLFSQQDKKEVDQLSIIPSYLPLIFFRKLTETIFLSFLTIFLRETLVAWQAWLGQWFAISVGAPRTCHQELDLTNSCWKAALKKISYTWWRHASRRMFLDSNFSCRLLWHFQNDPGCRGSLLQENIKFCSCAQLFFYEHQDLFPLLNESSTTPTHWPYSSPYSLFQVVSRFGVPFRPVRQKIYRNSP